MEKVYNNEQEGLNRGKNLPEIIYELKNLENVAGEFLQAIKENKVIAFQGELGAGKTTFITALCKKLGVIDEISSPTFSIIQEYQRENCNPVYHIDLYRVAGAQEASRAGVDECLQSGFFCFVEWPQHAATLFDQQTVFVTMKHLHGNVRKLIAHIPS